MRFFILITSLLLIFSACQGDSKTETKKEETKKTETPVAKKYKLTAFTPSQAYPDAKIESVSMKDGKFDFKVADGSYVLGSQTPDAGVKNCANSGKGQHIHALVDDKPYAARYTASFDDLKIEDGDHNFLAFLSRSYHESIKTADAHTALKIKVAGGSISGQELITEPMIWYSRPKGTYKGEAETKKVMLDFYLINTDLKGGNKVKADINGETHMLDTWQPYYIEGLGMGENTITLSLLDKDGNLVKAEQNPISRTFTLAEAIGE